MTSPLRLFVLAGEPSGDRLAAELVRRIGSRMPVALSGVGGPGLEGAGLVSLFPMQELSVMGWADVLPRLPRLLMRASQVAARIARERPDVVVLVDAQVFSAVVARAVRRRGSRVPIILYVAPSVWAWEPDRARRLRGLFDEVLAVLPFEPAVMQKLGGPPTSYVGHPAAHAFASRRDRPESGPLLLLPGSRDGELRRHLPIMRAIASRFADHPAVTSLLVPTPVAMRTRLEGEVAGWSVPVGVVVGESEKGSAFGEAVAAVAVTGTVTLELALAGVPMVTTYVADKGQAKRWQRYGVRYAALPNILLDRQLVPEILGTSPRPDDVGDALDSILAGRGANPQLDGFREIRHLIEQGMPDAVPVDAAERVLALAGRHRSATGT